MLQVALCLATIFAPGFGADLQDVALSLLERPTEPIFLPKGNIVLDFPDNYTTEKYKSEGRLPARVSGFASFPGFASSPGFDGPPPIRQVSVKSIAVPDISALLELSRYATFSNFVPTHSELAAKLVSIFLDMKSADEFLSAATYIRDRINPGLFVYAFSVAAMHRPDTSEIHLPPLSELFPDKFMDGAVFAKARAEANFLKPDARTPIEIPMDYTATNLEVEHRLAYFREDLGVNLHHWHWHLVHPNKGDLRVVAKDRRGELFYYMHQQIIARYDFERLCNKLPRVKRLQNFNDPIEEAYFPKLTSQVASRNWAGRPSGTVLKDINRETENIKFDIAQLQRWRDRIYEAIHRGRVELPNGTSIALDEHNGVEILGNIIETNDLSVNPKLYGNMHNMLHVAVGFVHDPDQRHLEAISVMGESATAMRDPIFYRIHSMVNDMLHEHKNTLPGYTTEQLAFPGVKVNGVSVETLNAEKNVIETFWQKNLVELSHGMDFNPEGSVKAKFTHLNHHDFQISVDVDNQGPARKALVRLFLAPKFDERGREWSFNDHKNTFIELDKFIVDLRPNKNTITRDSRQSSVTIPFERTFRDLEKERGRANRDDFCGCGWPQHMLVPKGTPEGFPSVIFAMVSDYKTDWNPKAANRKAGPCSDAASYCGIRDQAYPDRRAMGYPFDRLPRAGVSKLAKFLTPNMAIADVAIRFYDQVYDPYSSPQLQNPIRGERSFNTEPLGGPKKVHIDQD